MVVNGARLTEESSLRVACQPTPKTSCRGAEVDARLNQLGSAQQRRSWRSVFGSSVRKAVSAQLGPKCKAGEGPSPTNLASFIGSCSWNVSCGSPAASSGPAKSGSIAAPAKIGISCQWLLTLRGCQSAGLDEPTQRTANSIFRRENSGRRRRRC